MHFPVPGSEASRYWACTPHCGGSSMTESFWVWSFQLISCSWTTSQNWHWHWCRIEWTCCLTSVADWWCTNQPVQFDTISTSVNYWTATYSAHSSYSYIAPQSSCTCWLCDGCWCGAHLLLWWGWPILLGLLMIALFSLVPIRSIALFCSASLLVFLTVPAPSICYFIVACLVIRKHSLMLWLCMRMNWSNSADWCEKGHRIETVFLL